MAGGKHRRMVAVVVALLAGLVLTKPAPGLAATDASSEAAKPGEASATDAKQGQAAAPAPDQNGPSQNTPPGAGQHAAPGNTGQGEKDQAAKEQAAPKKASTYYTGAGSMKASKLVGATIFNDQKQQIGSISDVLLDKEGKAVTAVLSVGGFLGVGSRVVAVPFSRLDVEPDRIVVAGATKVSLENLPAFDPNAG